MIKTSSLSGLSTIAPNYDVILCDIWGVVHNGKAHYAKACAALSAFRRQGGTVILVTNAPRPFPPILEQLARLGAPSSAYDGIVTSGDVTLSFIVERGEAPLYHIGPERDLAFFDILKDRFGINPPRVDLEEASYVVCTGLFHDEQETPEDYQTSFATMLRRKLDFISANPDLIVHVGDQELYCAGALAHSYEHMGGRVYQAGKPFAPIYERALTLAAEQRKAPIDLGRVLAIGDAMRTDIRGAHDQKFHSIFISQGIHRAQLHPHSKTELGPLDETAFAEITQSAGIAPDYHMPELSW